MDAISTTIDAGTRPDETALVQRAWAGSCFDCVFLVHLLNQKLLRVTSRIFASQPTTERQGTLNKYKLVVRKKTPSLGICEAAENMLSTCRSNKPVPPGKRPLP